MICFYLFLTDLEKKIIEQCMYIDFRCYKVFWKFLKCWGHITYVYFLNNLARV